MRETKTTSSVLLEVVNPTTGNKFTARGSSEEVTKYYSIKRITSRVNSMDLLSILSKVCKSPKDIDLMNTLLDGANSESRVVIPNITAEAKHLGVARSKLNDVLSKAVKENFFHKISKGVYLVNPYVLIGRKVRSNEVREGLQKEWCSLTGNLEYLRKGKSV